MIKLAKLVLSVTVLLIAVSCIGESKVADNWLEIPSEGWNKDSAVHINCSITDTINYHQISIGVRNNEFYEYRNLWLFIETTTPSGIQHTDTVELMLASPEGKWYGSGWTSLYSVLAPYREVQFLEKGEFTFSIKQGMRNAMLNNIASVGIKIDKVE